MSLLPALFFRDQLRFFFPLGAAFPDRQYLLGPEHFQNLAVNSVIERGDPEDVLILALAASTSLLGLSGVLFVLCKGEVDGQVALLGFLPVEE